MLLLLDVPYDFSRYPHDHTVPFATSYTVGELHRSPAKSIRPIMQFRLRRTDGHGPLRTENELLLRRLHLEALSTSYREGIDPKTIPTNRLTSITPAVGSTHIGSSSSLF